MNEFDQFVKLTLKLKNYIRYTDDFVVVHHDVQYLTNTRDAMQEFLHEKLKLELHPQKTRIRKYRQGIDFLGYVISPGAKVVRTKTKRRILRKISEKVTAYQFGEISGKQFLGTLNSYLGVLSHANTHELKESILHDVWQKLSSNPSPK